MIVVDTNVIAHLFLEGEYTDGAEAVLNMDPEWVSPYLWRSEFRSVLGLYLRQGHLSIIDAERIMQEAESLMKGREYEVSSARVLNLASNSKCSVYDCEFVALAQQLEITLVTPNKQVLSAFSPTALSIGDFIRNL